MFRFAHLINVSFFDDLFAVMTDLVDNGVQSLNFMFISNNNKVVIVIIIVLFLILVIGNLPIVLVNLIKILVSIQY